MIRLQWNALEVGDHVLVHDETDPGLPLVPGRVTMVEAASGSHDVAIRIPSTRGPAKVVHPSRLAVHLDDHDPETRCWRCEAHQEERRRPPARGAESRDRRRIDGTRGVDPPDKSAQRPAGKKRDKPAEEKRQVERAKQDTKRTIPT